MKASDLRNRRVDRSALTDPTGQGHGRLLFRRFEAYRCPPFGEVAEYEFADLPGYGEVLLRVPAFALFVSMLVLDGVGDFMRHDANGRMVA